MDLAEWQLWWKRYGKSELNRILRASWNPIRVNVPGDEYKVYAGQIARLLRECASVTKTTMYLTYAATEYIGVPADLETDAAVADEIVAWYREAMALR